MKRLRYFLPGLLVLITSVSYAQSQPFVFTLFGGLFFPSHVDFKETYRTNSDIIWGVGFSLPVKSTLYIGSDVSYFRAKSLAESLTDSTMKLEERFIHIGVLNKQPLTGSFLIRLSAGLSYTTIKQISS
ncbi:MAG: hypothetical protein HY800_04010, partial [Ignavibacteriales bacterium]|nr:hypothetical protein [Ignavibacteriales bacterium]